MPMFFPASFTWITILVYLFASISGLGGMAFHKPALRRLGCTLALLAFVCQTLVLIFGFHRLVGLTLGSYLQMLAWFFLLCGIAAWWRLRHDTIILLAAPLGLMLFLMSASSLDMAINLPASLSTSFYALHIGALLLGLALICLAFIAAIIFIFLQKRIKSKKNIARLAQDMPALTLLDKINAVCVLGAFPLYTIGILAGLFWARPVFGATISGDPKEIASLAVWILLAILFHNRLASGWKGRKPAILAIMIFLVSILSILIINFFMASHHGLHP